MKLRFRIFLFVFFAGVTQCCPMNLIAKLFEKSLGLGGVVAPGGRVLFDDKFSDDSCDEDEEFEELFPGYFSRFKILQECKASLVGGKQLVNECVVFVFYPQIIESSSFERRFISDNFYLLRDIVLPFYDAIIWLDDELSRIWVVFPNSGDLRVVMESFSEKLNNWGIDRFKKTKLYAVCAAGLVNYRLISGSKLELSGTSVDEVKICSDAVKIPECESKRILCAPSIFSYFDIAGYNPPSTITESIVYKAYSFEAFKKLF